MSTLVSPEAMQTGGPGAAAPPHAARWLGPALRVQAGVAAALMLAACLLDVVGVPLGGAVAAGVLLAGMVLTGLPHGALDLHVARAALVPRSGGAWWLPFGLGYLALAGLVAVGWALAPGTVLLGFLLLAVVHFGLADREDGLVAAGLPPILAIPAHGALPVLPVLVLHPAGTAPLLALLAGRSPEALLPALHAAAWLLVPWGLAFLWAIAAAWREGRPVLERLAGLLGAVLLPPLLSFGLLFASGHATRHLLRLGARYSPESAAAAAAWLARTLVPAGLLCAAGLALAAAWSAGWPMAGRGGAAGALPGTLAVLFRTLAALTLPHMVLMPWLEARAEGSAAARP